MPEKTQGRSRRIYLGPRALFELLRWPIAQRRVQSAAVVIPLNELLDVRPQMVEILIFIGVNLFPFERLDETLAAGVGSGYQLRLIGTI